MKPIKTRYVLPKERPKEGLSLLEAFREARGYNDKAIDNTEMSKWALQIHDMPKAVELIRKAIENGDLIAIYGDYDVDGATAATLLYKGLLRSKAKMLPPYIPERTEGFGLTKAGVDKLVEMGAKVIITVDNGTSAKEAVEYAKSLGLTVIVTDHHPALEEEIAYAADAIVNPQLPSELNFPFLCGAGVAFMLLRALEKSGLVGKTANLISFVALATIADVMPVEYVNEVIVSIGVERKWWSKCTPLVLLDLMGLGVSKELITAYLNKHIKDATTDGLYKHCLFPGVVGGPAIWSKKHPLYVEHSPGRGLDYKKGRVTSVALGFEIGPRINAAGRLGQSQLALEFLMCEDLHKAWELALKLDELNTKRKAMQKVYQAQAEVKIAGLDDSQRTICLADNRWDHGIVGPVAAKIAERYGRPTFIGSITEAEESVQAATSQEVEVEATQEVEVEATQEGGVVETTVENEVIEKREANIKGSARGAAGVSCKEILLTAPGKSGGHEAAAGFELLASEWDEFVIAIEKAATLVLPEAPTVKDLKVDLIWKLPTEVELVQLAKEMEPFGKSTPPPVIAVEDLVVKEIIPSKNLDSTFTRYKLIQRGEPLRSIEVKSFLRLSDMQVGRVLEWTILEVDGVDLKLKEFEKGPKVELERSL